MRLFADHCPGSFRRQHTYRNLEPPSGLVNDRDRAISPLWSAHDLKSRTIEWVKTVEDVDVRGFCTQGTVGVGVIIRTSIVSSPPADSPLDHSRWTSTQPRFFLPMRVLSRLFRGKMLAFLRHAYRQEQLCFPGALAALSQPCAFHSLLRRLRNQEWVVYAKPPFGGPEHVLQYLARYTHRVAIANGRLLSLIDGQVRFRWRDSQHNNRSKVMQLDAVEFIRRFLLHVLPAGFVKIRHFGFLANRNRRKALALCRLHLRASLSVPTTLLTEQQQSALDRRCPRCKQGTLHIIARLTATLTTGTARFSVISSTRPELDHA